MNSGIYKIHFNTGKFYIGSSNFIERRLAYHKSALKHNNHSNEILQRAYNKNGINKMILEIIELCKVEDLIAREQHHIDMNINVLYNINKVAGSCMGFVHSEISKRKISENSSGSKNHFYGKKHSEESRLKLSNSLKKIKGTAEARLHNSKSHMGLQSGFKNGKSKPVINKLTGEIFGSIRLAAKSISVLPESLHRKLRGERKNNTEFVYYES